MLILKVFQKAMLLYQSFRSNLFFSFHMLIIEIHKFLKRQLYKRFEYKKCFFFTIVFFEMVLFSIIEGKDKKNSISSYLELFEKYPNLKQTGCQHLGEIEIVTDPIEILKIADSECKRLIDRNISPDLAEEWSLPGVVYSDPYLLWVRDPVIFPNGKTGLFKRIIWRCTLNREKPVAVLPVSTVGKIFLIKIWRHATGSWELELPRGAPEAGESGVETALRELKEETGFVTERIISMGNVNPDSGVLGTTLEVFMAIGFPKLSTEWDEGEAIEGIYAFNIDDLEEGIKNGFIEVSKNGNVSRINLRDPFLTYVLYQASLRKLGPYN